MTNDFTYPVALRALEKWKNNNLDLVGQANGTAHYKFLFNGNTCNNGGTPFKAYLHAEFDISKNEPVVNKAWIEIPPEQLENVGEMCGYRSSGDSFIESLSDFPDMEGRPVTDILSEDVALNHAGCFCTEPMINQKWRMALSTMHFALNGEDPS